MKLSRIAARPFLLFAAISTVIVLLWLWLRPEYDDGSWGTLLFVLAHTVGVVQIGAARLLHQLNGGWLPGHEAIALLVGSLPYLLADYFWSVRRRGSVVSGRRRSPS